MTITLYYNSSEVVAVNKTLTAIAVYNGKITGGFDSLHPVIKLQLDEIPADFNYLGISETGKYYFVDGWENTGGKFYNIECSEDVLYTFKDDILNATATATERENYNPYSSTVTFTTDSRTENKKIEFNNPFNENGVIVLVGAGAS